MVEYLGMTRKTAALRHLRRADPALYRVTIAHHASLPMQLRAKRTRAQLFESLVSIVISQQLGLAAADAIFARVKKACGERLTPEAVSMVRPQAFRRVGLSEAKIKTLKEIASAVRRDSLDLSSLKKISEAAAAERLMSIRGLGPWSAEMFLMFALGRGDVFSAGDRGLVRAMEAIYGLPKGSPRESFLAIAEKWSPHRTYASLLLWKTRDRFSGSKDTKAD